MVKASAFGIGAVALVLIGLGNTAAGPFIALSLLAALSYWIVSGKASGSTPAF